MDDFTLGETSTRWNSTSDAAMAPFRQSRARTAGRTREKHHELDFA
jgi:hypothetical protein